jgi:hypothetical protein
MIISDISGLWNSDNEDKLSLWLNHVVNYDGSIAAAWSIGGQPAMVV